MTTTNVMAKKIELPFLVAVINAHLKTAAWDSFSDDFRRHLCLSNSFLQAKAAFEADSQSQFESCLQQLASIVPFVKRFLQTEYLIGLAREKEILDIIVPAFDTLFESDHAAEALLELGLYWLESQRKYGNTTGGIHLEVGLGKTTATYAPFSPEIAKKTFCRKYVSLFILYGAESIITNDVLLSKLGQSHYEEYITRLPASDLMEFLTSDSEKARIKASNKVKQDANGEPN
jgi:hypothetical protein